MEKEERVEISSLRLFVSLASMGSISRMAVALETSQPAISRRIAALERAWGVRLFHRTGRGIQLTESGARLLPRAEAVLAQANQLADEIAGGAEIKGVVRIATLPSVSILAIPLLLQHFKATGLDIRLEVLEGSGGQVEEWVAEGRSDISILYRHGKPKSGEVVVKVVDSCLIGGASDALLQQFAVRFAQLDQLPLVLAPHPTVTRHLLNQLARRQRINLNIALEAASLGLQKLLPEKNGYYTVLPAFVVAEEVRAGRLRAVPLIEPAIPLSITVGHGTTTVLEPAVKEVIKILSASLPEQLDGI